MVVSVSRRALLLVILSVALETHVASGYMITLDADDQQCFTEKAAKADVLNLAFEVIEGGFLDIEMEVRGPDDAIMLQRDRKTSGRFSMAAWRDGVYTYCFSNRISTVTAKTLTFSMHLVPTNKTRLNATARGEDGHKILENMLGELSDAMGRVRREQAYLDQRARTHRRISRHTNRRVMLWSVFESMIMVFVATSQVAYLLKFFEMRRVV